jgi:flagellar biosynthesis protein FlhB
MIPQILNNAIKTIASSSSLREHFVSQDKEHFENSSYYALITTVTSLIVFVLVIIILALIGKYLWNTVVAGASKGTGLFTQIKPVEGISEIIGLYILVSLFLH